MKQYIYIEGSSLIPERFWTRVLLDESEIADYEEKDGYIIEVEKLLDKR